MLKTELYRRLGISMDLALEAHDLIRGDTGQEISGVTMERTNFEHGEVTIVKIINPEGAQRMGKPMGTYVTIDAFGMRQNDREVQKEISTLFAQQLSRLLRLEDHSNVLLVGLGNWHATPDALGPKVIEYSLVTRHLHKYAPEELKGGLRSVSALAPGVLGITGIETAEIIKGVIEKIKPDLIIVIDALAASSVKRIASTIQLADTGIHPGSGVGNKRAGINFDTMGVPVIAVGVPTVVHASIIAQEILDTFFDQLKTDPSLYKLYKGISPNFVEQIICSVMDPYCGDLVVTPKEIDQLITTIARIIANGLTEALHPSIKPEDYNLYTAH